MPGTTSKGVATAEDIKSISGGSFFGVKIEEGYWIFNARYLTELVPLFAFTGRDCGGGSFNVTPKPRCLVQYVCRVLLVCTDPNNPYCCTQYIPLRHSPFSFGLFPSMSPYTQSPSPPPLSPPRYLRGSYREYIQPLGRSNALIYTLSSTPHHLSLYILHLPLSTSPSRHHHLHRISRAHSLTHSLTYSPFSI